MTAINRPKKNNSTNKVVSNIIVISEVRERKNGSYIHKGVPYMSAEKEPQNWIERYLQEPFCKAELARAEMLRTNHPEKNAKGVIGTLAVFSTVYGGFCLYWFVKYFIA